MKKVHNFLIIVLIFISYINSFDLSDTTEKYEILKTTSTEYVKLVCRYRTIQYEIEMDAIDGVNEQILSSTDILRNTQNC